MAVIFETFGKIMMWLSMFLLMPVVAWVVAELRAKLGLRLLAGFFALITVGLVCFQTASVKPALENEDLRACLAEIQKASAKGEFEKIDAAYRAYESDLQTGRDDYQARREMLATLRTYKAK